MFLTHPNTTTSFDHFKNGLDTLKQLIDTKKSPEAKCLKRKFKQLTAKRLSKLEHIESESFRDGLVLGWARHEEIEKIDKIHDLGIIADMSFAKLYQMQRYYDSARTIRRVVSEIIKDSITFTDILKPYVMNLKDFYIPTV